MAAFALAACVSGGLTTFLTYIGIFLSQTFHRKPAAVERSELLYSLQSVMGARGMEAAARAQERAHEPLVQTN